MKLYREIGVELTWVAKYSNSSIIRQIEKNGKKNSYSGIPNRRDLAEFWLEDKKGVKVARVALSPTRSLFYRQRVALYVGSRNRERVHLLGYREIVNNKVQVMLFTVFSDGKVRMYRGFNAKSDWLYEPNWQAFEALPRQPWLRPGMKSV